MFAAPDYRLIDRAGLGASMFFPRMDWRPAPSGATEHTFTVEEGVAVAVRFFRYSVVAPTILFFHGNGEVAGDYDDLAGFFRQAGLNLLAAEYRGYGGSNGRPTFATMMADAHPIFRAAQDLLAAEGFTGKLLVMGRSLGCHSAAELAAHYPDELAGLISESGASGLARMLVALSAAGQGAVGDELALRHDAKLRSIRIPALVIHAERDELIPLDTAIGFYQQIGSPQKDLVIIPDAGHNDIQWVGLQPYFTALHNFARAVAH
ncbi:MAG: alpha/beta hydrolase [Chloroflexi bacterium]|nr:alpha/beta hydrolase [Chloroflexota bacterium]